MADFCGSPVRPVPDKGRYCWRRGRIAGLVLDRRNHGYAHCTCRQPGLFTIVGTAFHGLDCLWLLAPSGKCLKLPQSLACLVLLSWIANHRSKLQVLGWINALCLPAIVIRWLVLQCGEKPHQVRDFSSRSIWTPFGSHQYIDPPELVLATRSMFKLSLRQ